MEAVKIGAKKEERGMSYVTKRPPRMLLCPPETAVACTMTPMMKMAVAPMMLIFREYCSAGKLDSSVPTQAPNSRMDVSQPLRVWSAGSVES